MTYAGHKDKAHWNVSLRISNDESLYNLALTWIRTMPTKETADVCMLESLHAGGIKKTPDGFSYTKENILAALEGLE